MPKRVSGTVTINKKAAIFWLSVLGVVVIVAIGWICWHSVYLSPNNVFWGMIDNNLATTGITRHVTQQSAGQSADQYIQTQFNAAVAHSTITLKQGASTVKSETIGTPYYDYSRYVSIDSKQLGSNGKPNKMAGVTGVWAKSGNGQQSEAQYFRQSVLGLVPLANFSQEQRQNLIKQMRDKNVFDLGADKPKSSKENGRQVYIYQVSINLTSSIEVLTQFAKMLGLGGIGLDPGQYANNPPLQVQLTVDKLSRQLVKIKYLSTGQEEAFSSQGLEANVGIPQNTISLTELQRRIQKSTQ